MSTRGSGTLGPRARRRFLVGAAGLVVVFALALHVGASAFVLRAVDDVGQSVAAFLGAAACFWRARTTAGRWRVSWLMIGGGLTGWGLGELAWSYYEIVLRHDSPFPSVADIGFLAFPALVLPGVLVRPSAALSRRGLVRLVLDGVMVAASLFNLTWATTLGTTYHAGGSNSLEVAVSLAYPISDLVMVTAAVGVLVHARVRRGLPLLVAGLVAMAAADSVFLYLDAVGSYYTGSPDDIGWFAAFLLIGLSALVSPASAAEAQVERVESPVLLSLPYLVALLGGAAEVIAFVRHQAESFTLIVAAAVVLALVCRQLLAVLDNRRLALDVLAQREQLQHRATHDELTGLANRALFYDRLHHALDLQRRDGRTIAVLYVDLDDFKAINDNLGHQVGDTVLVEVAKRLGSALRAGDTAARLGGDEFAVLLEDGGDAEQVAARLQRSLRRPAALSGGHQVPVRASVGIASAGPADVGLSSDELLRRADLAMYAAKHHGDPGRPGPDTHRHALRQRLALRRAVEGGSTGVATVPVIRADGTRFATDVVARWSFEGAPIPPRRLAGLAHDAGVAADLDRAVARSATALAAASPGSAPVVVRLGPAALAGPDAWLTGLLDRTGLGPDRVLIEVGVADVPVSPHSLRRLREAGLRLVLDGVGGDPDELERLIELMPYAVKLDPRITCLLPTLPAAERIVGGLVDLIHDLGAAAVGQRVDTDELRTLLVGAGCDALQGEGLGRPEPVGDELEPAV